MSIKKKFDISFISSLALREKQIQQNYRPIIAVHKWFARRPGTLFRGPILSEFVDKPLRDVFYSSKYMFTSLFPIQLQYLWMGNRGQLKK